MPRVENNKAELIAEILKAGNDVFGSTTKRQKLPSNYKYTRKLLF